MPRCFEVQPFRLVAIGVITLGLVCSNAMQTQAIAQDGRFLEGLFRTIADAQLEREQRKRIELERRQEEEARKAAEEARRNPTPSSRPSSTRPTNGRPTNSIPTQSGRSNSGQPSVIARPPLGGSFSPGVQPGSRHGEKHGGIGGPMSINVRSKAAAEFVQQLVDLNATVDRLATQMQESVRKVPSVRGVIPQAFAVSAESRSLLAQCDGLSNPRTLIEPYRQLDIAWRNLSFGIRDLPALPDSFRANIRQGDTACKNLSRQLGLQPQFDRHGIHDEILIAATNMQALLDDLAITNISHRKCDQLSQQGRRLRQRLIAYADSVEQVSYDDFVAEFSGFVSEWDTYSESLIEFHDPHIDLRLDRIRQSGDRTYQMLWMPPPRRDRHLHQAAHALEQACASMMDQLTLRTLVSLRANEQIAVMQSARQLYDRCRELETMVARDPGAPGIQPLYVQIDGDWEKLRRRLGQIATIRPALLAGMDRQCQAMRDVFGFRGPSVPTMDIEQLTRAAASLEGAAEYFNADLKRFEGYMQPASSRRETMAASQGLYERAMELHAQLAHHDEPEELRATADKIRRHWETLSHAIEDASNHGLAGRRAQYLIQAHARLAPSVAQLAAGLM